MLQKLELYNFQSHTASEVIFDAGFNVIIGSSDSGKSSILRAFQWLATNKPKGLSFLQEGADAVEIQCIINDAEIIRYRTLKDTGEYVFTFGKASDQFACMSGEVPEVVLKAINMDEINIQAQLDSHYLILDTPGQAAITINKITKLDNLSNALNILKSSKTQLKRDLERQQGELVEIEKYFASGIVELHEKLNDLSMDIAIDVQEQETLNSKIKEATRLCNELQPVTKEIEEFIDLDDAIKVINVLDADFKKMQEIVDKTVLLNNLLDDLDDVDKKIDQENEACVIVENELIEIERQLEYCPACGSKLTINTKKILLAKGE